MTQTLEFDLFRQSMVTQVLNCCNQIGITVKLPNTRFHQPEDGSVWAEFNLMIGKSIRAELGSGERGLEKTACVFQLDLYVQENTGDGPITQVANQVKRFFNEKTFDVGNNAGYYRFDVVGVQDRGGNTAKRGFYGKCADAVVIFWHRNADAPLSA